MIDDTSYDEIRVMFVSSEGMNIEQFPDDLKKVIENVAEI